MSVYTPYALWHVELRRREPLAVSHLSFEPLNVFTSTLYLLQGWLMLAPEPLLYFWAHMNWV
jgi:hypothetical protein